MNPLAGVAVTACACLMVGGCSDPSPQPRGLPQGDDPVDLDPADLSTRIDNPAWPMAPGDRWIYRESEGGERLRVVVTVSSVTRRIANGVTARVVRDTVTQRGELVEDTVDWYAQDTEGTVWYLGEDTAEFEDGRVTTREGSFEAGVDGALPGVLLPGKPQVGTSYRQEYAEGVAEDNGEVVSLEAMAEVPAGFFRDVLMTKDTITIEPRVMELKFYAPGVGPVLALGVSGGSGREELVQKVVVPDRVARRAGTTALGASYE